MPGSSNGIAHAGMAPQKGKRARPVARVKIGCAVVAGAVLAFMELASAQSGAIAPQSVVNAKALRAIYSDIPTRLVDTIINADSNGLFGGYGWDHGFQHALLLLFGGGSMYASGVHAFGENDGFGNGVGYGHSLVDPQNYIRYRSDGSAASATGIPNELTNYWNSQLDPTPAPLFRNHLVERVWLSTTDPGINSARRNGLALGVNNPIGLGGPDTPLQYQAWLAKFSRDDGFGSIGQARLLQVFGGPSVYLPDFHTTDNGPTRVPVIPFTFDLAERSDRFEVIRQDPDPTTPASYPFAGYFQRIVRRDQAWGHSTSMGYTVGSSTTTHCRNYLERDGPRKIGESPPGGAVPAGLKGAAAPARRMAHARRE